MIIQIEYLPRLSDWSSYDVGLLFIGSLFLSFSLGVWVLALAKGNPLPSPNVSTSQTRVPIYLRERVPHSGTRAGKACLGTFAMIGLMIFNTLSVLSLDNLRSSCCNGQHWIGIWLPLGVAYALTIFMGLWTLCVSGGFLQLVIEAVLGREFEIDVFTVPTSIMVYSWVALIWPIIAITGWLFPRAVGKWISSEDQSNISQEKDIAREKEGRRPHIQ